MGKKETKLNLSIVLIAIALCMAGVAKSAPMGTAFTYQGRLADANSPADGLYDFEFEVYDALDGGSQQGSTVDVNDLDVIDGYFTVQLDFRGDPNVFNGNARWLQIAVRPGEIEGDNLFVALSPRQEITPVPYALKTRGIFVDRDGNVGISTTNPSEKLDVNGKVSASAYTGGSPLIFEAPSGIERMRIEETGNVGIGTMMPWAKLEVEADSGKAIHGKAAGDNGKGVQGTATATGISVENYGGYFVAGGYSGRAVYGMATAVGLAENYGGYFSAAGELGNGVYATASGTFVQGVYGEATGNSGRGVQGMATALGNYENYGGYFEAAGDIGHGVYGEATGITGTGIYGKATYTSDINYGVRGETASSRGYAGYFTGGQGVRIYDPTVEGAHLQLQSSAVDPFVTLGAVDFLGAAETVIGGILYRRNFLGDSLVFAVDQEEHMYINESGNVGIGGGGTTRLDIWSETDDMVLARINQMGTPQYSGLRLDRNSDEKWFIGMNDVDDDLIFRWSAESDYMVIDNMTGNVGIGTTNPTEKLEVADYDPAVLLMNCTYPLDPSTLKIIAGQGSTGISSYGDLTISLPIANTDLVFTLGGLTRMRLNSLGNLGIADDTPTERLSVNGRIAVADVPVWNGDAEYDVTWNYNTDIISREGSSRRYKQDIRSFQEDFRKILRLEAKQYQMREGYGEPGKQSFGYIAEDLEEAGLTKLLTYDSEGRPDAIKYKKMGIYLIEIVKEQQKIIDEQNSGLAELRTKMARLETVVQKLEAMTAFSSRDASGGSL